MVSKEWQCLSGLGCWGYKGVPGGYSKPIRVRWGDSEFLLWGSLR